MEAILLNHTELAAVVAGFASVVAAFKRPLDPVQKHRFLTILFASLLQIIACLTPVWLMAIREVGPLFWSVVSGVNLGFSVLLWAILVYPLRKLGASSVIAINMPITIVTYLLGFSSFVVLLVNTFLSKIAGFGLYYSSLLAGLTIIFFVFADAVTRAD